MPTTQLALAPAKIGGLLWCGYGKEEFSRMMRHTLNAAAEEVTGASTEAPHLGSSRVD